ncbi:MAG TPA: SRPBCC domain-containing protein [archaeon]|nr:SRPBCC domain-containing protein [archaeon]
MAKTTTIKQKVLIPWVKPAEVYEAFLSSKGHTALTGSKATASDKVGGRFTAWDGYIFGKNVKLVANKKIVQEWQTTEWPEDAEPSTFELTFTAKKGGTEISMVHSNVPAEQAAGYKSGWNEFYWNPMKKYFAGRK